MQQRLKYIIQNSNKTECFYKINNIDKPLTRFIKKKSIQISKIRNERTVITPDCTEIKSI